MQQHPSEQGEINIKIKAIQGYAPRNNSDEESKNQLYRRVKVNISANK